ncbi:MAG: hypothetical protein JWN85_2130 [Gammaproteobacteria bacterium]|jgi:hypothetical protein|nr:hypothetical protein [Gammaproteobacteria bacterium]
MRFVPALALALACYAQVQPAHADFLRCGSALIEAGDSAARTLEKCGAPTSTTTINEPVWARDVNGRVYPFLNAQLDVWRYSFGPGKFPARVRINDGIVESITFESNRE